MKTKTMILMLAIVLIAGFAVALAQPSTVAYCDDDPNAPPPPELCLQTTACNQAALLDDDDPNAPPPPELF